MSDNERVRYAIYAAIVVALRSGHPKRFAVARALDRLAATSYPLSE